MNSRSSRFTALPPILLAGLALTTQAASADAPAAYQVTTPSGLQYTDLAVGSGPPSHSAETVTVHYTGTFEDGRKFDSSRDRGTPFSFILGRHNVIQGWDEGIAGMQVGGHRLLRVPAALAYGPSGYGDIPPNTTLLFDVELLDAHW